MNIAGLVPGDTNAKMDAEAFVWKNQQDNDRLNPDWSFEFKSLTDSYTAKAAMDDLKKKMEDSGDPRACHGMLIAITNARKSRCEYCIVERDDKAYLRVVVVIGFSKLSRHDFV